MVDATERMKGVDAEMLLEKCQLFLPGKWKKITINDFDFKVLSVGFGNRLFVCKIKDDDKVPSILVRLYGGNVLPRDAPIRTLTETTEALLFYKLGELGYGPRLLGTFEGGRLEEFISGTRMAIGEFVTNPNVASALAKVMARYHRLDIPLSRKPWDIVNITKTCYQKFQEEYPQLVGRHKDKGRDVGKYESMRAVIEYDVEEMLDWIMKVMSKLETRIVFTHNDANRSNIIITGSSPDLDDKNLVERLMLIDCEFSGYSYRGQDIGNAFCMRKFDFAGENFISGYEYPNEADRRLFIESYVEDMRASKYYEDWDEEGIDSVDHILMESEFGSIFVRFINVVWCLRDLDMWNELQAKRPQDPSFGMSAFTLFIDNKRREFVNKYPQFLFPK